MPRNFTVVDVPQRSPEWFAARAGRATGSRAGDIVAKLKGGGEAAARRDYRMQLVVERLTGQPAEDTYTNADMQRGIELEPAAIAAYEARTGLLVSRCGFLASTDMQAGCSLDGYVGDYEGIVEVKCPRPATHVKYLRSSDYAPKEHMPQVLHNLLVSGAKWCQFVSFCPSMPGPLRLYIATFYADGNGDKLQDYENALRAFLAEVDTEVDALRTLMRSAA